MKEKKQLNEEDLNSVNGGTGGDGEFLHCEKCGEDFLLSSTNSRKIGGGCDYYYEYQCPKCEHWN